MKILVGMSGGVDSSVTALLLKQAGHQVIGATMAIWDDSNTAHIPENANGCFAPDKDDVEAAAAVCKTIGIPHLVLDCREEYKRIVLSNFKSEYKSGRTPNPCVICNANIKFRVLPETAAKSGIQFDKFATGHYAGIRLNPSTDMYQITRGNKKKKDQSYFLYRLSQHQLSNIILPLGEKNKSEIRALARQAGLSVSDKPDSQDFYSGEINDILQFPPQVGNFINSAGKILGTHQGYWNFTIGQRRGLGISAPRPLYVIAINKDYNEVIVGYAEECTKTELVADNWVWQSLLPSQPFSCQAKIRSSQTPCDVEVTPLTDGEIRITFLSPQSAVTPGQSVVLYEDNAIIGGGIIK